MSRRRPTLPPSAPSYSSSQMPSAQPSAAATLTPAPGEYSTSSPFSTSSYMLRPSSAKYITAWQ